MNRLIIYQYINRLSYNDVVNFCNYKNIDVSDNELQIIYGYIKNDYKRFFDNPNVVLNEVKDKVSDNTFKEIMILYDKYKNKIKWENSHFIFFDY